MFPSTIASVTQRLSPLIEGCRKWRKRYSVSRERVSKSTLMLTKMKEWKRQTKRDIETPIEYEHESSVFIAQGRHALARRPGFHVSTLVVPEYQARHPAFPVKKYQKSPFAYRRRKHAQPHEQSPLQAHAEPPKTIIDKSRKSAHLHDQTAIQYCRFLGCPFFLAQHGVFSVSGENTSKMGPARTSDRPSPGATPNPSGVRTAKRAQQSWAEGDLCRPNLGCFPFLGAGCLLRGGHMCAAWTTWRIQRR
jgi:hypothetical protein